MDNVSKLLFFEAQLNLSTVRSMHEKPYFNWLLLISVDSPGTLTFQGVNV